MDVEYEEKSCSTDQNDSLISFVLSWITPDLQLLVAVIMLKSLQSPLLWISNPFFFCLFSACLSLLSYLLLSAKVASFYLFLKYSCFYWIKATYYFTGLGRENMVPCNSKSELVVCFVLFAGSVCLWGGFFPAILKPISFKNWNTLNWLLPKHLYIKL